MTDTSGTDRGRDGARDIPVWDPLVRLVHWSLAAAVLVNGYLTDAEGAAHEWIGYAVLALLAARLVWALVGPRHARFSAFPPSPGRAIRYVRSWAAGDRAIHLSHNPLGALMVYNLWLTLIVIGVSGYMTTTYRFFGVEWVAEMHETAFDWLLGSIALHVAGVLFDTWRSGVNLVGAMVSGRKRIPPGADAE